jgi:uncharacterized membrane protein YdjX (TVP38/TMEM64 family)
MGDGDIMGKIIALVLGLTLGAVILYGLFWLVFLKAVPKAINHYRAYKKTSRKYGNEINKIVGDDAARKVTPINKGRKKR